jgi:hypothetical protein
VLRYVFRGLVVLTLLVMYLSRSGQMGPYSFLAFTYWFMASLVLFAAFGLYSAYRAFRDPANRRAYLFDILIAVSWVPFWMAMVRSR